MLYNTFFFFNFLLLICILVHVHTTSLPTRVATTTSSINLLFTYRVTRAMLLPPTWFDKSPSKVIWIMLIILPRLKRDLGLDLSLCGHLQETWSYT